MCIEEEKEVDAQEETMWHTRENKCANSRRGNGELAKYIFLVLGSKNFINSPVADYSIYNILKENA